MNPLFKPVMIRRDNEEEGDECGQDDVAGVVLAGSEQRDAAERSRNEDGQTVGRETGAGGGPASDQPFDSADQLLKLPGARVPPLSGDDTWKPSMTSMTNPVVEHPASWSVHMASDYIDVQICSRGCWR